MKYKIDFEQFWAEDAIAHEENCFNKNASRVALGIRMTDECVFAELNEEGNPWGSIPLERRIELNKRYNDKAEKIVGRRLLNEDFLPPDASFPAVKQIGEVFGGEYIFDGNTTWLKGNTHSIKELEQLLNKINDMDLKQFILPENFEDEKKRIFDQYGRKPSVWRGVRGPVTLAMSIFGVENLIYLILDERELSEYFRDTILKVITAYIDIFDKEAGYSEQDKPGDFYFFDDDCALLNPDMYELFGYPVLKAVFEKCCPKKEHFRFQHSDSNMAHLLPVLSKLNLTACNFGPTLTVSEIRKWMPDTRIDGQLAPFTFMSNDEEAIIAEVKRDCEMIKASGCRGLNLTTAGSINNGSLLTSMRAVMYAIQEYGHYN